MLFSHGNDTLLINNKSTQPLLEPWYFYTVEQLSAVCLQFFPIVNTNIYKARHSGYNHVMCHVVHDVYHMEVWYIYTTTFPNALPFSICRLYIDTKQLYLYPSACVPFSLEWTSIASFPGRCTPIGRSIPDNSRPIGTNMFVLGLLQCSLGHESRPLYTHCPYCLYYGL